MALRSFEGAEPEVAASAYVDEAAVVIGDVRVGPEASVWPNATLRGDHGRLVVGEGANVQDGATLHETVEIEPYATVGHAAIVHDATVRTRATVGMGAVVLDDAVVGERALVGAGAVVTEGTTVPPDTLVTGTPAAVRRELDPDDSRWTTAGERYVELSRRHADGSERLDRRDRPNG